MSRNTTKFLALFMASLAVLFFVPANFSQSNDQDIGPELFSQLEYRHIGPEGNRVSAVAGIPGNPNVYYAGAASGGIFKSSDAGVRWTPIFDDQPVSSIGSLAVSQSDPSVVWAGTGETFLRSNISIGNGIYKSTDSGKTWKNMGLDKTGRIGRIAIHPKNPDIVYAAAMGHCYGPQPDRGVFRTTNGGQSWEKVLFVDENTGCSDIALDPNNPDVLFAGMWQVLIRTWNKESGGPGSGLYMSRDGGSTWKHLTGNGLPDTLLGKIGVAIAPNNPERIYALIETGDGVPWDGKETTVGVLWRSDNGGENWKMVNPDRQLAGRCDYYTRCAVAPDDADEVYFLAAAFSMSLDGGETSKGVSGFHFDNHDMWIDPSDGNRMIVGNDGGVFISVNRAKTWNWIRLPIAQMYHVATDNQIPYNVYGNQQDGPSQRGPSNSRLFGQGIPIGLWHSVAGGESGWALPDPVDNNIIWASSSGLGSVGGALERYDESRRQYRKVDIWPDSPIGWIAADLKYRFQWTFPVIISPHDHNTIYAGSQYVHVTTDGGQSWKVISPDLSTNDKSKQQYSGGLSGMNIDVEHCCVLFALAESPLEKGVIWAGTNDGLLHITRDSGQSWTNVTQNIPDLPPWGTVSNIEASRYDAGACYITVDFHQVNNRDPYVYRTEDYGKSWKSISSDIPKSVFSYAHCVREDPVRKGLLYLGTENAIYVSFNNGDNWQPLQINLPHAPVHWLTIQEHFNDLVVATYGRGFWILDDITPIRGLTPDIVASEANLFSPRPAYRFRPITPPSSQAEDPSAGVNPPYGAAINYYLKSATEDEVKIIISDESNQIVKTIDGTKEPGINRIWWDLTYEPSKEIKLRTRPLYASHIKVGPEGWRPLPAVLGSQVAVLAPPGNYTVKLAVGEQEFSESLVVKKDPHSAGSEADIQKQVKILLEIRDNMNTLADMINRIEWIRKQIYDLEALLKEDKESSAIVDAGKALDNKLIALEENFFQMKLTGRGQDFLRWPSKLAHKIPMLAYTISVSDFPPTSQQEEVHRLLQEQLNAHNDQLTVLLDKDLAAFNSLLRDSDVSHIIVVKSP